MVVVDCLCRCETSVRIFDLVFLDKTIRLIKMVINQHKINFRGCDFAVLIFNNILMVCQTRGC